MVGKHDFSEVLPFTRCFNSLLLLLPIETRSSLQIRFESRYGVNHFKNTAVKKGSLSHAGAVFLHLAAGPAREL